MPCARRSKIGERSSCSSLAICRLIADGETCNRSDAARIERDWAVSLKYRRAVKSIARLRCKGPAPEPATPNAGRCCILGNTLIFTLIWHQRPFGSNLRASGNTAAAPNRRVRCPSSTCCPTPGMNYTLNRPLLDGTSPARLKEIGAVAPRTSRTTIHGTPSGSSSPGQPKTKSVGPTRPPTTTAPSSTCRPETRVTSSMTISPAAGRSR